MWGKTNQDLQAGTQPMAEGPALSKEFNYFLRINDADLQVLKQYQSLLTEGATSFAESYYDYLFAFPATAELMYAYEREGGDVGALVRKQMQHLLSLLGGEVPGKQATRPYQVNPDAADNAIRPVWVMGIYRLYLSHLQRAIGNLEMDGVERMRLCEATGKLIFRDMGMMLAGTGNGADTGQATTPIRHMLENIPHVLWSVDIIRNQLLFIGPTADWACKVDNDNLIPCMDRTLAEDRQLVQMSWLRAMRGEPVDVDARVQLPDGKIRWYRRRFYPARDADGKVARIDGVMEDITETKRSLERLEHLATSDVLTGLANRTLWYDRLTQAIAVARRNSDRQVVVMILDINHFKIINDTLGHPSGDRILRQVAQRLQTVLRDSDTLARLGGDEFAVLLPGVMEAGQAAELVARKMHECFVEPFWHDGDELYLNAAIGISIYPDHGEDADSLLSRADIAMYGAKRHETGFLFYDPGSDLPAAEHLQISGGLRHALERGQFELVYQPKVDMEGRRISGVEALLRWHHPTRGLILPERFIPVAEQIGLITHITEWVLTTALKQCRTWREAGIDMPVAVNVSARSFQSPRLIEIVRRALDETGVSADSLEIEITENTLMADLSRGAEILTKLSSLGIRVAIDDFGTGYSSLSYLRQLPINTIKIDKSFLSDMATDDNDAVIVRSIIDLGHNLGYRVIAEGVEDRDAWDLLEILGCDAVQGYHISHPLPESGLSNWMIECPYDGRLN
jgi:diguanylate cyclase (GGDEF)-like protein